MGDGGVVSFHILRVLMMDVKPGGKLSSSPHPGAEELFCNILQQWWMVVIGDD
jgi:hypothetical protein